MKKHFQHIARTLRLNRTITVAVVITSALVCTISVILVIKMHEEALKGAFVVNGEGEVIPLKWVDQRENFRVETLAHLEQFHRWFYGVDAGSFERNMERALWLGDATVDAVYRQKKVEGLYNRLLQYSLVQKVVGIESRVDLDEAPHRFETRTLIAIHRGAVTDTFELVTTGKLIRVDRNFPYNPHGLLITDFFENSIRKIENDETTEK